MRRGLGPVFAFEWLLSSRRWQLYAMRSIFISSLLIGLVVIWWTNDRADALSSIRAQAKLGEYYFYALIGIELALVMLAAPASAASAICVDRARGLLAHILVTDITDSEIVLGKLAARLLPVFTLVACSWPVLALASLLGGIDPLTLTLAIGVIMAVGILGCTLALTISVWAKKTHEVVLATYTFWTLVLIAYPVWMALSFGGLAPGPPHWVLLANPFFLAFAPYIEPARITPWHFLTYFAITALVTLVLTALAVFHVRRISTHETVRLQRQRFWTRPINFIGWLIRHLPGPSLDGNPVLWREWHRGRPSRFMTVLVGSIALATTIPALWDTIHIFAYGIKSMGPRLGAFAAMIQMILGLLMLAAAAPMSLSEERQRGSLDVLLATPLSTRSIVLGKWLGTFRVVPLLVICPTLFALALAVCDINTWVATLPASARGMYDTIPLPKRILAVTLVAFTLVAHGAATTSVGLALATWIKRQSRAIALGVGLFVMAAIAWPIFLSVIMPRTGGVDSTTARLSAASPILAFANILDLLFIRFADHYKLVFWITLWNCLILVFAAVVLEFTMRTFNNKFERMPVGQTMLTSPLSKPRTELELVFGDV